MRAFSQGTRVVRTRRSGGAENGCKGGSTSGWVRVFVPFALGYYLSYLLRTVNAVISPRLTDELGLSAASLGLLTSAYFLAFGAAQIPVGIALDRFGPRRVEAALLLLAALGSALFAMADSLGALAGARAMVGLGVSACLMAALKGFTLWYPP
ncbi:MAG TPA: MFS transporter, partial [Thauera aminoaromatica]|nr:MFS transporter [Thauera aminoaromatica]